MDNAMRFEDWRELRSAEMHRFRGKVTMIGKLLASGSYTAAQAVREIANADAEVERRFADINAQWDASRS